jgi:HKD family nuclease
MLRKLSALSALCSLSLFLQACGSNSAPASNGSGGGGSSTSAFLTVSATSLTFPNTTVGQTSAAQAVTVTNTGNASATLNSVVLSGNTSDFTQTASTCGSSLAAAASCTLSITFNPLSASTFTLTVTVTDSATNSPQSLILTGTGTSVPVPTAALSPTSITFPSTNAGSTASAQILTLSNTGNAALAITGIALGGTNPTDFAQTNNCGSSLNASGSCTISVTFTPALASTTYTATLTVTDNTGGSSGSTQTASLTGTGAAATSTISYQLLTFGLAANGATGTYYTTPAPLYTFINSAKKTIDMTMYELQDTTFTADLIAQCNAGVKVRVLLSASESSNNATAYNALNTSGSSNCSAENSNTAFTNTHQKTITIDSGTSTAQTAILSLNLQSQYYSTTRDFAMIENDPVDIAAIEATFAQDWAAGTPYNGSQGPSDFSYQPGPGDDLIWSPTTAQADMLALITNAKSTILLENEEMSASNIVSALETACQNGVTVHIAMVNSSTSPPYSTYATNFKALEAAGCGVRTYPDTQTGIYIHAKALIADYGLSTQKVYMGSINYSTASMTQNRELGMYISDAPSITTLYSVMSTDYAGATTF